jgi:hypothetical protein
MCVWTTSTYVGMHTSNGTAVNVRITEHSANTCESTSTRFRDTTVATFYVSVTLCSAKMAWVRWVAVLFQAQSPVVIKATDDPRHTFSVDPSETRQCCCSVASSQFSALVCLCCCVRNICITKESWLLAGPTDGTGGVRHQAGPGRAERARRMTARIYQLHVCLDRPWRRGCDGEGGGPSAPPLHHP